MNNCIDCKYFHQLREIIKGIWHIKSCCTYNSEHGNNYEDCVVVTKETNTCELWEKGEDKWLTEI